ncbi:hypothetical protein [Amycolatopsis sp. WGS_07]|uniref:hypothetical protein n=1 Tax=Amycolatopsis sp. WGS_07 TaxID=3076764 RepID=UPI0038734D2A
MPCTGVGGSTTGGGGGTYCDFTDAAAGRTWPSGVTSTADAARSTGLGPLPGWTIVSDCGCPNGSEDSRFSPLCWAYEFNASTAWPRALSAACTCAA